MNKALLRQEGDRVLIHINDSTTLNMSWKEAETFWRAIKRKAQAAEEWAKAESIAFDHAILQRVGAPFGGLSSNPEIQALGEHEAAWNRDLRRYIRGGVKKQERVGVPGVINHGD